MFAKETSDITDEPFQSPPLTVLCSVHPKEKRVERDDVKGPSQPKMAHLWFWISDL